MAISLEESRREVRQLIKERGRRKYDVWTGYAAKGEIYFNIAGSPRYLHLLWMEGDPEVQSYAIPALNERPSPQALHENVQPDAICILRSRDIEWRLVKANDLNDGTKSDHAAQEALLRQEAQKVGVKLKVVTNAMLNRHAQLIMNWQHGLAYIQAALAFDLTSYEREVMTVVGTESSTSLGNILAAYSPDYESLLIPAVFRLIQKGVLASDLAVTPFGRATSIRGIVQS